MANSTSRRVNVRALTVTAMLSAVAFLLMFIEFSLPIIPSFIKLDISDLPALLGAFSLGPIYGIIVELLKNVLHIVIKGTSTGCIGELSNFMLGAFFACTAGLIYKSKKSRGVAIIASVVGALIMGVLSVPSNYFVVYPMYTKFMPIGAIIEAYKAILPSLDSIFPGMNDLLKVLIVFNLPFTFFKGILDALICFFIYKPLSPVLKGKKN